MASAAKEMVPNVSRSAAQVPVRPHHQHHQHIIQPALDYQHRESDIPGEALEFIHIGKTAGGSIEEFGRRLGHKWGEARSYPELADRDMPC